ncbi:MAG TPA: SUMF1/EgtB/PvdO family nonheme iron enzyme, partial [Accumulibacter sp.]|uniref:formylglycine-generating enzyme family protein n=1 Tax=Accumulibacter sp. TaxID=2053492 RepID=UPI002C99FD3C
IAIHPVTYRQYRAFLDDPQGYRDERWWQDLRHEKEPGQQSRPIGNCPAENVSWYDTIAYCRWASVRLGHEVRLPTEWEWQQAATGGDPTRTYPWGREWAERRANTHESGLSRTTAVGMYPAGATPQGVLDMAGNVWEWCLNPFYLPNDPSPSGDSRRVVRGGSWGLVRELVRCAVRFNNHPGARDDNLGFRVLCVSPILKR